MARVGLFGGTFNPIHIAHLILAETALTGAGLDKVIFLPAKAPPHKGCADLAPAADRLRMVELAIESNKAFGASPLELERDGPSYTLISTRQLRDRLGPGTELLLILGSDSVRDLPDWWHSDELVQEVEFVVLARPGHGLDEMPEVEGAFGAEIAQKLREALLPAPLLEVSSTCIRSRIGRGESIRYLVPEPVRRYIEERRLYAEA